MTLQDGYIKNIQRVRLPYWESPDCYLQLDFLPGGLGPWGHLYDRRVQELINVPTPQDILIVGMIGNDWVPYEGSLDRQA
jgi:hypothetical protein